MSTEMQSQEQWQNKIKLLKKLIADWENAEITVEEVKATLENFPGGEDYVLLFERVVRKSGDAGEALSSILGRVREEEYIIDADQAPMTGGIRDSEYGPPGPTPGLS